MPVDPACPVLNAVALELWGEIDVAILELRADLRKRLDRWLDSHEELLRYSGLGALNGCSASPRGPASPMAGSLVVTERELARERQTMHSERSRCRKTTAPASVLGFIEAKHEMIVKADSPFKSESNSLFGSESPLSRPEVALKRVVGRPASPHKRDSINPRRQNSPLLVPQNIVEEEIPLPPGRLEDLYDDPPPPPATDAPPTQPDVPEPFSQTRVRAADSGHTTPSDRFQMNRKGDVSEGPSELSSEPEPSPKGQKSLEVNGDASQGLPVAGGSTRRHSGVSDGKRLANIGALLPANSRKGDYLFQENREKAKMNQTLIEKITGSRVYEFISVLLIVSNAALTGAQAEYDSTRAVSNALAGQPQDPDSLQGFEVAQSIFAALFLVDLLLRWSAEGLMAFFTSGELRWNLFDISIVSFSVIDAFVLSMLSGSGKKSIVSNASLLRVIRVVRIVRVVRVIRVMRFFKELRMMIYSIVGSLKTLLWVMLTLLLVLFIFGISFTVGTMDYLSSHGLDPDDKNAHALVYYFGTLHICLLNLYMSMTGGRNWSDLIEPLYLLSPFYSMIFLLYITFAMLAVINIVTGIYVDVAMQCNMGDRDVVVQEELAEKNEYLKIMEQVFHEMDSDNTGLISLSEFEAKLDDERVIAYFNSLKLDASDARKLFLLLDHDHSGEIDISEFILGCHKLKGESRALDQAIMQLELRWCSENVAKLQSMLHTVIEKQTAERLK